MGLYHERRCHTTEHGELVDDRLRGGGWLGNVRLSRHAFVRVQRGCHGAIVVFRELTRALPRGASKSMQRSRWPGVEHGITSQHRIRLTQREPSARFLRKSNWTLADFVEQRRDSGMTVCDMNVAASPVQRPGLWRVR